MRKLLAPLTVAGILAVAGVSYALVAAPGPAAAQDDTDTATTTTAVPATAPTDDTGDAGSVEIGPGGRFGPAFGHRALDGVLEDVLDDLVADGSITEDQADLITSAVEAKHDELRSEREDRGGAFGGADRRGGPLGANRFGRGGLGGLLDDGVIDADELAELGEDHPLLDADGPLAQVIEEGGYLDDGELAADELRPIHDALRDRAPWSTAPPTGDGEG